MSETWALRKIENEYVQSFGAGKAQKKYSDRQDMKCK